VKLKLLTELIAALGTLVGASVLLLIGLELAPGTPADLVPDPDLGQLLASRWGLDQPVLMRAWAWFSGVVIGDLGTSWSVRPGAPVWEIIRAPLGHTALLLGLACPLALGIACLPSRLRPVLIAVSAAPVFLLGQLLIDGLNSATWAAMGAGWLVRPAWFALPGVDHPLRTLLAALALALGSNLAGGLSAQLARSRLQRQRSEFAAVARVHGTPGPGLRHAIVDALPLLLAQLPILVGGTVVAERVFLMNGAGSVLWEAAMARDFELAMAIALLAAALIAGLGLLIEATHIALDPRTRELS